MPRRLLTGCLTGVCGWIVGAFAGGWLTLRFSPNLHDRSLEAAMSGAFVYGPVAGVLAFALGAWLAGGRRPPAANPQG